MILICTVCVCVLFSFVWIVIVLIMALYVWSKEGCRIIIALYF